MHEQTLYKVVNPIKPHVVKKINRSKKWEYGYNKEYDVVISNPPFGVLEKDNKSPRYTGSQIDYKIIDLLLDKCKQGYFILPSLNVPFTTGEHGSTEFMDEKTKLLGIDKRLIFAEQF